MKLGGPILGPAVGGLVSILVILWLDGFLKLLENGNFGQCGNVG
jgi:hypothetical protein